MGLRNIRYSGLGVDPNTALVAPEPWIYFDASEIGLDSPSETNMVVPSMMGMTARKKRAGAYIPEGNIALNTDIFTIGYLLKWSLMGYAFTAGTASSVGPPAVPGTFNTHEMWGDDRRYMEALCARIGKDEFEHIFRGVVIGSLEFNIEQEFIELSAETSASKDYEGTLKNIVTDVVPKLPAEYALAYHDVELFIDKAGVVMQNVSALAMSLSGTIENNTDAERGIRLGSRFSRKIGSSGRDVSMSAELDFENMNQKRNFWGETNAGLGTPGKLGSKVFPVEVTIDSGPTRGTVDNYGKALISMPACYYSTVPTAPSGREEMSNEIEIMVLEDTVTLADGVTKVSTPFYVKLNNRAPSMTAAPVFPIPA